jgi:hypothetical protein
VLGLRRSLNLQSGPEWIFDHVREVASEYDHDRISLKEGARRLANPTPPEEKAPRDPLPVEWALARGLKDGAQMAVAVYPRAYPRGRMGGNTGVPLAIGLELLRRGRTAGPGVRPPEAAVRHEDFFAALAPLVDPPMQSAEQLVAVEKQVLAPAATSP